MAFSSGIRIDRLKHLRSRLSVAQDLVTDVFMEHIVEAAEEATQVMEVRILTAETYTGQERATLGGNGPGRVDSGNLFDSLRNDDGSPYTVVSRDTRNNVTFNFGYQQPNYNSRGQDYTAAQDEGDYSVSGKLLAAQHGYNYFVGAVLEKMSAAAAELGDYVESGKLARRASKAHGRGTW